MKKLKLSDKDFNQIKDEDFSIEFWKFQLGVGYVYHNRESGPKFSKPYPKIGAKFWKLINQSIHSVLCDETEPKDSVKEILEGDIRSIAEGILSIVVATYEVTLAIGVPITALIMRKGIYKFCLDKPDKTKAINEVKQTLEKKSLKIKKKKKKKGKNR